jgi:hypothetical protein
VLHRGGAAPASGSPAAREGVRDGCCARRAGANARQPAVVAALGDARGTVGTAA